MDRLFFDGGLMQGYLDHVKQQASERPIDRLQLPAFRRVLVRTAVRQLVEGLGHPDAAAVNDAATVLEVVEEFSRSAQLINLQPSQVAEHLLLVLGHGDLHGGNILVTGVNRTSPVLVDLASFGHHHWAVDMARLSADIILRCVDNGVEAFLWRRFATWRLLAQRVASLDESVGDADPSNHAAIAALRWITQHHDRLLTPLREPARRWEWHVALAEQFLRGTYQPDLSPAKRTLALVAAYDQILAAHRVLPRRESTF
jgi:hypothetical protein